MYVCVLAMDHSAQYRAVTKLAVVSCTLLNEASCLFQNLLFTFVLMKSLVLILLVFKVVEGRQVDLLILKLNTKMAASSPSVALISMWSNQI